jgi:phosphatidylglycerophosphate synthase
MKHNYAKFKALNIRSDQQRNDVTHFFSRHCVNPVAYIFYLLGFTPNQVTAVFILTGIIGAGFAFNGSFLIAYFLWRLHIIIDMADGSVARVTGMMSEYGDVLDKVGHHVIYPLYWVGILYATNAIFEEPFLAIIFYAVASSQWTAKHLVKDKSLRPQAKSISKRIVANAMGVEGFIFGSLIYVAFDAVTNGHYLLLFVVTNSLLLMAKIYSLLLKGS